MLDYQPFEFVQPPADAHSGGVFALVWDYQAVTSRVSFALGKGSHVSDGEAPTRVPVSAFQSVPIREPPIWHPSQERILLALNRNRIDRE